MAIYIGFDSSTQGLTAVAIDVRGGVREIVFAEVLNFDAGWPEYGTHHGVVRSDDPLVALAPPLVWVDALERMMGELARGVDLSSVRAIAGSAQQHGSVYLARGATAMLGSLDPGRALADQLRPLLSRAMSPIWRDASTTTECREIAAAMGGAQAVASLTGSRPFERFTGPQVRRFATREPDAYARTERIHLVSSFLCSLLVGASAPLDPGDASGMNLMDLAARQWSDAALDATAPGLRDRLPPIVPSDRIVGRLAPYWRQRYGWPDVAVTVWSGDNPCSLIGTGLVRPGTVAVSLGTSDTVFGVMAAPSVDTSGTGHVFGAPTGEYMGLTCFQNGSLARERIRDLYGLDWDGFSRALASTPAGNRGRVLLPWFEPEITPLVLTPGVRRFDLAPDDVGGNVRGVVEGQMLALARHSSWMGVEIATIRATGGAAVNRDLLTVMADVFDADVYQCDTRNSAALGAALRAWHADAGASRRPRGWDDIVRGFTDPLASSRVVPDPSRVAVYRTLRARHAACELAALGA